LIDSVGNHEVRKHTTSEDFRTQVMSGFKIKISRELAGKYGRQAVQISEFGEDPTGLVESSEPRRW